MTDAELCGWWRIVSTATDYQAEAVGTFLFRITETPAGLQLSADHWSCRYLLRVQSATPIGALVQLTADAYHLPNLQGISNFAGDWSKMLRRVPPPVVSL